MKELPYLFTILFLSDVGTTIFSMMIFGGFPDTNPYTAVLVNNALKWCIIKIIIYVIIYLWYKYSSDDSNRPDNIMSVIIIIYGILMLLNINHVVTNFPVFNIEPEFYDSINESKFVILPHQILP